MCERDEGFAVDLVVSADIGEFMRSLARAFPSWFALSPFAART